MSVSIFSGHVTRTWEVEVEDRKHQIQLSHHTVTGSRGLALDNKDVPDTKGKNRMFGKPSRLEFTVGDANGFVNILPTKKGSFKYECFLNGKKVPEINETLGNDDQEDKYDIKVLVEDTLGVEGPKQKKFTWYKVCSTRDCDGHSTVVHRRFRDFFSINELIRTSYKGSHLISSLPSLPKRGMKLFSDHLSPKFVENRRQGLQTYMQQLERMPRMRGNSDFLTFIGIKGNVREASVMFLEGPLGVSLKNERERGTFISNVNADGQAAKTGRLHVGDRLTKVNGESMIRAPYAEVIKVIKDSPRPLVLHFLGVFEGDGEEVDNAVEGFEAGGGQAGDSDEEVEAEEKSEGANTPTPKPSASEEKTAESRASSKPSTTTTTATSSSSGPKPFSMPTPAMAPLPLEGNDDANLFGEPTGSEAKTTEKGLFDDVGLEDESSKKPKEKPLFGDDDYSPAHRGPSAGDLVSDSGVETSSDLFGGRTTEVDVADLFGDG